MNATNSTNNVQGPLVVASYAAATEQFSGVRTLLSPELGDAAAGTPPTGERIGYPVFLPDDSALLFENEVRTSGSDSVMVTRNGARSELWWLTLGTGSQATPLYALNGKNPGGGSVYLPILPNDHGIGGASDKEDKYSEVGWDDTTLDYEPTVLPVVVGGYAWVVFTSRRAYGNQLTEVPWQSWPPDYDTTSLADAPTKKLWVAAIDLNAPPAPIPSHPAFYPPGAGEIRAGKLARLLGARPVRAERRVVHVGRSVLQRVLRAVGRRRAHLHERGDVELRRGPGQVHDRGGLLRQHEPVHQRVLLRGASAEVGGTASSMRCRAGRRSMRVAPASKEMHRLFVRRDALRPRDAALDVCRCERCLRCRGDPPRRQERTLSPGKRAYLLVSQKERCSGAVSEGRTDPLGALGPRLRARCGCGRMAHPRAQHGAGVEGTPPG